MQEKEQPPRSAFLLAIGDAATEQLCANSRRIHLARGEVLFNQGEMAHDLFIIDHGSVALLARADGVRRTMVEIFRDGEIFLAPAVVLDLPYLATAQALTEVELLAVPAAELRRGMADNHEISRAMVDQLGRHWRLLVEQIIDLKLRPAERRVARFLAQRVREEGGTGAAHLPEPRTAIAARLGMTPETLSRSLHALQSQRCIRVMADTVHVLDRERLLAST
ncbi:MAG: cyclic nucleotide-binding domain-containing protein [Acetobacteraceae bacterium]|nr:cyclic nucleotide-binding domain-containing protein [Acetobacteraceae bacterium]